jgi:hypothetical protein
MKRLSSNLLYRGKRAFLRCPAHPSILSERYLTAAPFVHAGAVSPTQNASPALVIAWSAGWPGYSRFGSNPAVAAAVALPPLGADGCRWQSPMNERLLVAVGHSKAAVPLSANSSHSGLRP